MTTTSLNQSNPRTIRLDAGIHRFSIGQGVQLKGGVREVLKGTDTFRVTGTLPSRGNVPQYRIRNDDERHERVTTEDNLEPLGQLLLAEGATLTERTFGNGQGTEKTQQSGNPQTEAREGSAEK